MNRQGVIKEGFWVALEMAVQSRTCKLVGMENKEDIMSSRSNQCKNHRQIRSFDSQLEIYNIMAIPFFAAVAASLKIHPQCPPYYYHPMVQIGSRKYYSRIKETGRFKQQ